MKTNTLIPHLIVVHLFKKLTVPEMIDYIKSNKVITTESVKQVFHGFSNPSEVQVVSTKLSLLDPLKLSRIVIPCRAETCKHIQCFDLENYLLVNERLPRWVCPICDQPAHFNDIRYDQYFSSILQAIENDPDITQVFIQPNGQWIAIPQPGYDNPSISPPDSPSDSARPINIERETKSSDTGSPNLIKSTQDMEVRVSSIPVIVVLDEE